MKRLLLGSDVGTEGMLCRARLQLMKRTIEAAKVLRASIPGGKSAKARSSASKDSLRAK